MKKVKPLIMLSCKKAAELIDKKSVAFLTLKEKLQLQMHNAICDGCLAYEKQSKLIDEMLVKHVRNKDEIKTPKKEIKALKEKIISKL